MDVMRSKPRTFLDSIAVLSSDISTGSKTLSQGNIFAAISAEVGFSGLNAIVRRALEERME